MDLDHLTIKKFHEGLLDKQFSALEAAQAFFARIKASDEAIGAYLSTAEESAAREAEAVDVALAKGDDVPTLAGIPLAIKDCILVKDLPATSASKMLERYVASYDAGAIARLKERRAVFLGKTNMDEFAMGSSTENSAFKKTRNPHDLSRVPGGSSGGSAAAVAAHMAVASLGSDTFGSIRQPSAFCGVVGFKPTYGAVSRSGLIAMTSSMDQIGPITQTVEDAAIMFAAIAGRDPVDATSSETHYDETALTNPDLGGIRRLRIGLPEEYFVDGPDREVGAAMDEAIRRIEGLGLKTKKVSLPHTKYAVPAYYLSMPAEVSSNLARLDGIRYARIPEVDRDAKTLRDIYFKQKGIGFGPETKRRVILGAFVLSSGYYDAYYDRAQRARTLIARDFDRVFEDVDVLMTPVTPTPAFKIGEKTDDPLAMYLSDVFTGPVNLAGLPAISIPVKPYPYPGGGRELPIGFQLIGKKWREADILGLGQYYERI